MRFTVTWAPTARRALASRRLHGKGAESCASARLTTDGFMPTWTSEAEFWSLVVRYGLPHFRWFRQATPIVNVDKELCDYPPWNKIRLEIQPNDKIWPFQFPQSSRYWGKKSGYVVLRRGQFIGGVVTHSE